MLFFCKDNCGSWTDKIAGGELRAFWFTFDLVTWFNNPQATESRTPGVCVIICEDCQCYAKVDDPTVIRVFHA